MFLGSQQEVILNRHFSLWAASTVGFNACQLTVITTLSRTNWAIMSKSHTSAFNVEFYLYDMCISDCTSQPAQWISCIACHYCDHMHHSVSFIKQVCPTVRPHLNYTDRWSGKGQLLRLRTKELPHCTTYALLPCSRSPHNVLQSPS